MTNDDMRKNSEGYSDPTVYNALKNIEKDGDERFHKLLDAIFTICELSGFHIEERIIVKEKHIKTYEKWGKTKICGDKRK